MPSERSAVARSVGYLSQRWGRRRLIIIAGHLRLLLIPMWVFSPALPAIVGGFSCNLWCRERGEWFPSI